MNPSAICASRRKRAQSLLDDHGPGPDLFPEWDPESLFASDFEAAVPLLDWAEEFGDTELGGAAPSWAAHSCRPGEGPPAPLPDPEGRGLHPLVYRGVSRRRSRNPAAGDAQRLLNRFLHQLARGSFPCRSDLSSADRAALARMGDDLRRRGQYPLTVDCRFGTSTRIATLMFQRCVFPDRRAWDGKIGPRTWAKLELLRPHGGTVAPPRPTPAPPRPSVTTGFLPSIHGFRFVNSFTLPPSITGPLARLRIPVGSGGYGLCGGMSFLAGDYFLFGVPVPTTATVPPTGSTLYNKLVRRQLDSLKLNISSALRGFGGPVLKFHRWMGLPDRGPGSVAELTAPELGTVASSLGHRRIVMLGLVLVSRSTGALTDNHQVLAYGITVRSAKRYELHVYDPNYPRRDDIRLEVRLVGREAVTTQLVGSTRRPVRGFFVMPYGAVRP